MLRALGGSFCFKVEGRRRGNEITCNCMLECHRCIVILGNRTDWNGKVVRVSLLFVSRA